MKRIEVINKGTGPKFIFKPDSMDIFKYGRSDGFSRTLNDLTLGFNKLSSYNDPFEEHFFFRYHVKKGIYQSQFADNSVEGWKNVRLNHESNDAHKLFEDIKKYLNGFSATCFSYDALEPLMWSHYANEHKGVCYCFNKDTIFNETYMCRDIGYASLIPNVTFYEDHTLEEQFHDQIREVIFTKSDNWKYEQECRYVVEGDEKAHKFNPRSLEGIILGSRYSGSVDEAKQVVHSYNKMHSTDVFLYRANQSATSFKMQVSVDVTIGQQPISSYMWPYKTTEPYQPKD